MSTAARPQSLAPTAPGSWWSWCQRYAVPIFACSFFFVYLFVFYREFDEENQWQLYRRASHRLMAGETINVREAHMYSYPPAMAMLSIPLALLPEFWSHGAWYLVNVGAVCVTVVSAWRLAGGGRLVGLTGPWKWIFVLGIFLAARHLISPLENHQYDMVIAAFLMSGCLAIHRGQELRGGALLGISAAMKLTPMLFAPYLIWRGRPKAAALMVVVAATLNLIPDLAWPQADGDSYLVDWHHNCLASIVKTPGKWLGDETNILNQSLAGWVNRITSKLQQADVAFANPQTSKWFLYGLELTLAAVTAWCFGRPFASEPPVDARETCPVPIDRLRHALECGAVMCLMLLYSPMSSKAHYAPMLLPTFLIARLAIERGGKLWTSLVLLLVATGFLATKGLLGRTLGEVLLLWGIPTGYVVVSLVGCWVALRQTRTADERPTTPQGTHWRLSRQVAGERSRRG